MVHYVLGDIVTEISERENNPSNSSYERFVGLEHYVSGEVEIENYGSTSNLNSAMKVFKSGDILVARRNVYLKRASVVYFDGLTSGDSIVLRSKDETIGRILPFILNTDEFWDYADQYSDGTMSKRLSPKVLKKYEFDLPEDNLEQFADILWAMVDVKKSYQTLLKQTDELVKSQFIELFSGESFEKEALAQNVEEMFIGPFGSALKNECFVDIEKSYCMVYEQKHAIQKSMDVATRYVDEKKYRELKRFTVAPGDIIVSCRGTIGEIYMIPDGAPIGIMHPSIMKIRLKKDKYDGTFFVFLLEQYMRENIAKANGTSVKMAVSASALGKELFIVPSMENQKAFMDFVQQADKSKFELKQAIEGVDILIKSLIQQELNGKLQVQIEH